MLINVKEIVKIVKINNVKDVTNVLKQFARSSHLPRSIIINTWSQLTPVKSLSRQPCFHQETSVPRHRKRKTRTSTIFGPTMLARSH